MTSSLFQSEQMNLCQLFLQPEAAYNCISELGELGLVEFRDLNPEATNFQRKFVNEVRRCDDMERALRYLEKEIKNESIPMLDTGECPEAPQPREMIDLEATLEKLEGELREVNTNYHTLKRNFLDLTELRHILRKTQVFFDERDGDGQPADLPAILDEANFTGQIAPGSALGDLGFVAGVILREKLASFERMLWRACRGNVLLRHAEIDTPLEDPITGSEVIKNVFIVFFQGDQLKTKVKKICDGFRAIIYPCPDNPTERREMSLGVMTRIEDLNTVLSQTNDHRHRVLVSAAKNIRIWFIKVRKIKAIYHTLNCFNVNTSEKCLVGECWIPVADTENIQLALRRGTDRAGSTVPPILNPMATKEKPPTYHRVNKFTKGFQVLIDSYGIASYREVNPAPYTIITFPFLFAVMFGDAGHALIMLAFGAWMVICEKKLEKWKDVGEIWDIFFGGRYIILLMGLFSFYTGLIYNDWFSKSINIFGSAWFVNGTAHNAEEIFANQTIEKDMMLDPKNAMYEHAYPFGLDPAWMLAENKINFLNTYKMKISIILGVIHMLFGVMLSLWNAIYFRRAVDIFCEFIPQLIFMVCLFFYLVVLMFYKWVFYGANIKDNLHDEHCAPSILISFINMVLFKYGEGDPNCEFMFPGQKMIQTVFVVVGVLCIPVMLFIKPFVLRSEARKKQAMRGGPPSVQTYPEGQTNYGADMVDSEGNPAATTSQIKRSNSMASSSKGKASHGGGHGHDEEEFEMSEVFIHQGIHTIEYVLGSVSHTASYLRLWALSLAHAQLAEVLWSMVMRIGLTGPKYIGAIMLFVIFAAWAVLTVSILVLMEGLSAFLHTLRLHWVEFQSKFYKGEGYVFAPFSFHEILAAARAADADATQKVGQ